MKLNETAIKPLRAEARPRAALPMPDDRARAPQASPGASRMFEGPSPGGRRDDIEWIVEAKRAGTRASRIATAVAWIADGKPRHWKYRKSRVVPTTI